MASACGPPAAGVVTDPGYSKAPSAGGYAEPASGYGGGYGGGGTVHVHGYYRRNGTYVGGYDRRAPSHRGRR
jgi:hypothetical protein